MSFLGKGSWNIKSSSEGASEINVLHGLVWHEQHMICFLNCQPGNSNVLLNRHSHAWLFSKLFYSWIHGLFISAPCLFPVWQFFTLDKSFHLFILLLLWVVFTPFHIAIAMGNLKLKASDAVFCCFVATFSCFLFGRKNSLLYCVGGLSCVLPSLHQRVSSPLK